MNYLAPYPKILNTLVFFVIFTAQAQTITNFRFTAAATGWNEDFVGIINNGNKTIRFTTQKWIENIEKLPATFELDGNYEVTIGGTVQVSGITANDFRKDVIYTINGNVHYTVTFISPQASGLPLLNINTENNAGITSKEDYVNMVFALTDPDNPVNAVSKTNMKDLIRGRGNDSWYNANAKKKSYRIKFDKKTSLFGLEAAKSWVLIAQYRDATLLYNTIAFELGDRFALPYNHSYNFVELYLNGDYKGNYLLTEQNQVNPGRVDIDENEGWFIEIDGYYDEEPKFKTSNYDLPVMIKSPEFEPVNISNPAFDFVRKEVNALTDSVASSYFPENGYRDLLNMNTFIDFLMITEICDNKEIRTPMSTYMYKDKGSLINMGPLWDFDCGYGYNYSYTHFLSPNARTPMNRFFEKLFEDPVFLVKYKERWNEKYEDIASLPDFIDETVSKLEKSARQNFQTWWYRTYAPWTDSHPYEQNDFLGSVSKLKNYYTTHVSYLHNELNKVKVFPANKDFGTEISTYAFTLVSYGTLDELTAKFGKGNLSGFEFVESIQMEATGNGGYLTSIYVKPKNALPVGSYNDALILSGKNQGNSFSLRLLVNFMENGEKPGEITGIDDIPQENPLKAWVRNNLLHISGLAVGKPLSIYTTTGVLVYKNIATSDEADIPLKIPGVYIVQSGNNTIKVTFN